MCKRLPCSNSKNSVLCFPLPLKEAFNASLRKSCSRKQAINKFMKASEILMKRNEADLEEIKKLFQKNGYETHVKDSTGNISWQYSM